MYRKLTLKVTFWPDWHPMRQFYEFLDTFSVRFGSLSQDEQKIDLKRSHICLIWCQSDPIRAEMRDLVTLTELVLTSVGVTGRRSTGRRSCGAGTITGLIDWKDFTLLTVEYSASELWYSAWVEYTGLKLVSTAWKSKVDHKRRKKSSCHAKVREN